MRFQFSLIILSLCFIPLGGASALENGSARQSAGARGPAPLVVVRGRVTCLNDAGQPAANQRECDEPGRRYGFAGTDRKFYTVSPDDEMASLFSDARVRERDLQITALLHDKDRLEITKVQSIKQGKLYDIYYFCELCNIKAYGPGPCPCCRNELEFRETPVPEP